MTQNEGRLKSHLEKAKYHNIERFILEYNYGSEAIPFLDEDYLQITNCKNKIENIAHDRKILWESFLKGLRDNHPNLSRGDLTKINMAAQNICPPFRYNKIITINYDLVLYWVIQKANELIGKNHFKDAFLNYIDREENKDILREFLPSNNFIENHVLLFGIKNPQINVFYLHGAIHIFDSGPYTFKIRRSNQDDTPLSLKEIITQLNKIIKKKKAFKYFKPTMVLEGSSEFKERYISNSMYLSDMYNRLDTIKGNIVIYGCNILDENNDLNNDIHIWRVVFKKNKFNKIYVGIFEDNDEFTHKKNAIIDRIKKIRASSSEPTEVTFFSTSQRPTIWDSSH